MLPKLKNLPGSKLWLAAIAVAVVVGLGVAWQGTSLRSLGSHLGDRLWSYAYSGAASLAGSLGIFLMAWLFLACFSARSDVLRAKKLFENGVFISKHYFLSGVPGACYIIIFAATIDAVGTVVAMVSGVFGLMLYAVVAGWRILGLRRPWVIAGAVCMLLATTFVSLGLAVVTTQVSLFDIPYIVSMVAGGAGIGWQFAKLAEMRGESSTLAAAIISSATGLATAVVIVLGFALFRGSITPDNPWPTVREGWWMYVVSLVAVVIIYGGAFASNELGKQTYTFCMTFGSLSASLAIDWFSVSATTATVVLKLIGFGFAVLGVFLCLIDVKDGRPVLPILSALPASK